MDRAGDFQFWSKIERIREAEDTATLRDATSDMFSDAGFQASYFLAPISVDPNVGRVLSNIGFPDQWEAEYRVSGRLLDPLPGLAMISDTAIRWPEEVPTGILPAEQVEYMARLADYGMEQGLGVACFGPFARCGFVGVGMASSPEAFSPRNRLRVEVGARLSFRRYVSLMAPFGCDLPQLSPREIEVLKYMAMGKSNAVIAIILGISPHSVQEYVRRVFAKFGVGDRASASVMALSLGYIVAGDFPGEEIA